jgi:HAE1 family hydrophobic/amphiphilic exporter-1
VAIADVYKRLQAYLGGLYLNQFNRFGRQWRVFLQSEGEMRRPNRHHQLLRPEQGWRHGAAIGVGFHRSIAGPEYTNRFNLYRSAQIIGAAAPVTVLVRRWMRWMK